MSVDFYKCVKPNKVGFSKGGKVKTIKHALIWSRSQNLEIGKKLVKLVVLFEINKDQRGIVPFLHNLIEFPHA